MKQLDVDTKRLSTIAGSLALLSLLAACATPPVALHGEMAIAAGQYEEGIKLLEAAAAAPGSRQEARASLLRNRAYVLDRLEQEAHSAMDAGRLDAAAALFARMKPLDAARAEAGAKRIAILQELGKLLDKAEGAFRSGDFDKAHALLKQVFDQAPNHPRALDLMTRLAEKSAPATPSLPELGPEYQKQITLEFRDVGLKSVFDALWHASGINFVLDRDIRSDAKATILVKNVSVREAVDAILATQQLAKRVLGPRLIYVYPRTPQKLGEYQDLLIRNFFLVHVSSKEILNLLKSILKVKEVYADEARNLIVVRDTPERVALAEKLIQAQDQPAPEVMLAVDVIEINRSKLQDLGIVWPQKLEFGVANPISLQALNSLNSSGISAGVGGLSSGGAAGTGILAQLNLAMNMGDTKTLANPRIRVRNREKAKIHIGDRLPVVTTNTTVSTTNFVSQNVSYLDVGIKLEVEPEVLLDNDVVIKLNMEVSSATQDKANPTFYDVGTRNTSTVLTIRDGETQVLAGLIRDDEAETRSGIPGLGELPLLGRFFSSNHKNKAKTEILLAITPHVLRNLQRPTPRLLEYFSGSETGQSSAAAGSPPARLEKTDVVRPARAPTRTNIFPAPPNVNTNFSSPSVAPTSMPAASAPVSSGTPTTVIPGSSAGSSGSPTTVIPSTGAVSSADTAVPVFEGPPGVGSLPGQ